MGAIVPLSVGEGDVAAEVARATTNVMGAVVWVMAASTDPPLVRTWGLYLVAKVRVILLHPPHTTPSSSKLSHWSELLLHQKYFSFAKKQNRNKTTKRKTLTHQQLPR